MGKTWITVLKPAAVRSIDIAGQPPTADVFEGHRLRHLWLDRWCAIEVVVASTGLLCGWLGLFVGIPWLLTSESSTAVPTWLRIALGACAVLLPTAFGLNKHLGRQRSGLPPVEMLLPIELGEYRDVLQLVQSDEVARAYVGAVLAQGRELSAVELAALRSRHDSGLVAGMAARNLLANDQAFRWAQRETTTTPTDAGGGGVEISLPQAAC